MSIAEDERRKDEELDRQALLAEQRREEERLLQEEQQREKMVKIKAVEGKINDLLRVLNTNMVISRPMSLKYCSSFANFMRCQDQLKNSISFFITNLSKGRGGTSPVVVMSTLCTGFHISSLALKGSEMSYNTGSRVMYV